MTRSIALTLMLLATSSLLLIDSVSAQTIPKPSVPQFTAKYFDYSYDVPTTTTMINDPFTGKQIPQVNNGYPVDNRTVTLYIKNQPVPQTDSEHTLSVFYSFRYRGSFGGDWLYSPDSATGKYGYLQGSTSDETVVDFTLPGMSLAHHVSIRNGSVIDFQVKAHIGYQTLYDTHVVFTGEDGDWSNTVTVRTGEASSSPSVSPIQTDYGSTAGAEKPLFIVNFDWLTVGIFAFAVVVVVLLFALFFTMKRKIKRLEHKNEKI